MKYKLCEYVNELGTHSWIIRYKYDWLPILWFIYYFDNYTYLCSYTNKETALADIANLKIYDKMRNKKLIKCEVIL